MNSLRQVGITGGIGSGKSLVCKIFQCLGIPVYDADSRAKNLMTTDGILVNQIKEEFGTLSYRTDGSLDRAYLSETAFGNPEKLEKLNKLVHPRVATDYTRWLEEKQGNRYVLKEAALMYESGSYKGMETVIVVSAPEEIRIRRIRARDPHRTEDEIRAIIKNQWAEEEKVKMAHEVISNDDEHLVIPQVLRLHAKFIS